MRLSVALAVSTVLPFAVACSSYADTSAKQVEKDVKAAMADVKSVHIAGDITQEGTKLSLDLSLNTDGDCEGTLGLGTMGEFEMISTGGKSYVKPDAAFWKASGAGAIADKVKGKWVAGGDTFGDLTTFCDLKGLLKSMTADDDKYSKVTSTDTKVDGEDVVKVAFASTDDAKGTLYVASDEPHHLVKADLGEDGSLTFSEFDEPVEPKAPAKNQVIDASKLG